MKNTIKMSLVAAVAVAGLSTTAGAVQLEEAIKGVDITGQVRYRYEDTDSNLAGGVSTQNNDYDIEITAKVPVNDKVTATVMVDVDGTTNDTTGDVNVPVNIEEAYFTYTAPYATIMAGKQGIPGPFDDGQTGTGVVAMIPAGPVTIAAGHFMNTSAAAGDDATELAIMGSVEMVNFSAWYYDVDNNYDGYSIQADATVGPVSVDIRHSEKDVDNSTATTDDVSLTKITVSGNVAGATLTAAYATTGDDNAAGRTPAIDNDNDAAVDFKLFQASAGALADADAWLIGASMPLGPVTAQLTYLDVDFGTNSDADELMARVTYPMSSNFRVQATYSQYEVSTAGTKTTDSDKGRLELRYSF